MDHHNIFFDTNCHYGEIQNSPQAWQQIRHAQFSNGEVQNGSNGATPYHKFEENRSKRKRRADLQHSRLNHRVSSAKKNLRRQPFSYHDVHRSRSTRCYPPDSFFNQNSSLPQEHSTINVTCSDRSASSLCSNNVGSPSSTLDTAFEQYNQICNGKESKHDTRKLIIEAIRERLLSMLKDTGLRPNGDELLLLQANDMIPVHPFILGVGTFSRVTKIAIRTKNGNLKENTKEYACKKLKEELLLNPKDYIKAAIELAYEAYILSCFDHQNIIKLRGYNADGIASFGGVAIGTHENLSSTFLSDRVNPPVPSFFLIMDVLRETLDQRIERWKTNDRPKGIIGFLQRNIEKISLCLQLASALEYIHSKGVVFRDLKPQNIGFCEKEGKNLKLFDFGLSRELPRSIDFATESNQSNYDTNEHMRFDLSGVVGTIRYMAPEVCLSQPYNWECDIYSWSIVAWEIWSQSKPFAVFTPDLYRTLVCRQGYRPADEEFHRCFQKKVPEYDDDTVLVPLNIKSLLKRAWKREPHERIRWSAIQFHLDGFQKSENLLLKESMKT